MVFIMEFSESLGKRTSEFAAWFKQSSKTPSSTRNPNRIPLCSICGYASSLSKYTESHLIYTELTGITDVYAYLLI